MEIRLTYHAVRRYLERVEGINLKPVFSDMRSLGYRRVDLIDYLKREFGFTERLLALGMIPERVMRSARVCNGQTLVRHGGMMYVIRGGSIITIKPG